ncbi:MAG: hypothetical protein QGG31_02035, partial [Anaerolineales bacterium]|nr:hypothetical protein [Anaerolineales bacterium]
MSDVAESVAESTSSKQLLAAAELVRRKRELAQKGEDVARLRVEEMQIEVELAAARSTRGSQTSSVRRRYPGPLDGLVHGSPEPLLAKMQRLQDSAAQHSSSSGLLVVPNLPAITNTAEFGYPLEPHEAAAQPPDDSVPRASEDTGTKTVYVQNNLIKNEMSVHVDQSLHVAQQATLAIAHVQQEAVLNQQYIENLAEHHVATTIHNAAAHCEAVQQQADQQQRLAAAHCEALHIQAAQQQDFVARESAGMHQYMQDANATIAQLRGQQEASDRMAEMLQQKLLDAEAVRKAEVERAYEEGERAATKPEQRAISTSYGASTPQRYTIASPPASVHGAAPTGVLSAMIADAVSAAVSAAIGLAKGGTALPAAAGGVAIGDAPAAAGLAVTPYVPESVLPAAAGSAEQPSRPPPTTAVVMEVKRPADLPRSSSLPELPGVVKMTVATMMAPVTTRTGASSSRGRSRKRDDEPPDGRPPPKPDPPPAGGGGGGKKDYPGGGPGGPPGGGGGGGGGGDDPDSSSDSSFGSARSDESRKSTTRLLKRIANKDKVKESSEVKVPVLPTANQFRAWKHTVYQNVNAASGRHDDKALEWIRECERIGSLPEEFKTCHRRFATLDRKLAAALSKCATGELGRLLIQLSEDALNENRSVRGRELLRTIIHYYSTGKTAEVVFSLNDLQSVKAKPDQLENFHNTWIMVLKCLTKRPDDEILEYLYYQQVKGMKALSEDIHHYNRQEVGHVDKSYDYL